LQNIHPVPDSSGRKNPAKVSHKGCTGKTEPDKPGLTFPNQGRGKGNTADMKVGDAARRSGRYGQPE